MSTITADRPVRLDMDGPTVIAIFGAAAVAATAFITGLWQFFAGRKKSNSDAQASVLNGFVLLLGEFRNERVSLISRINEMEAHGQKQDRRIMQLELLVVRNKIELPPEPG